MSRSPASRIAAALVAAAVVPAAHAVEFTPTANLQYEWDEVDSRLAPAEGEDGFRRARLGFRIAADDGRWQFVAEHDFADRTPPDAYLEYRPASGHAIRVGQFKQPFSLEDANSDKETPFLEASFVGNLAISRRIGVEYGLVGKRGTLAVAAYGDRLDGTQESEGVSLRATRVLVDGERGRAHVGFSLASERPDTERSAFSAAPGTAFTDLRVASTGSLAATGRLDRAALEGLWMRGPWTVQAEVAQVRAAREALPDFNGNASSALLTWSPSGHARGYRRAVATRPAADGIAWELALRWSAIDLDDGTVEGGHAESVGIAATAYFGKHVRVVANVLRFDSRRRGVADEPVVTGVRLQFNY